MDKTPIISAEKLRDILPHGSGIDCNWCIYTAKNGNIQAKNAFHAMTEDGYYDGYMNFTVFIYREKEDLFQPLHGPLKGKTAVLRRKGDICFDIRCNDKRCNSFYGLRDYLIDTIHESLRSILTVRNELI